MESTEESVQEYTEPDGTKVIKKTIITRIRSSGHKSGSGSSSSHFLSNSGRLGASAASSPSRTSTLNYADPKTLNEFEKAFLNKHNEYRKLHGVPALQMSKELCSYAQEWAANIASKGQLSHRPNNKYGENIFYMSGTNINVTGDVPVTNWYSEIKDFDKSWYNAEPPRGAFSSTGHFTQVVWKASERVGVGTATKGNAVFVVANYDVAGNLINHYKGNVLPPKK